MESQFDDAGLDPDYPFGGEDDYLGRSTERNHHTNPERIKWVKDHANN